jgi:hypothetical protein
MNKGSNPVGVAGTNATENKQLGATAEQTSPAKYHEGTKCARKGCGQPRFAGDIYCSACSLLAASRDDGGAGLTCDSLPIVDSRVGRIHDSGSTDVCPGCGRSALPLGRESGLCLGCCREGVETEQPNDGARCGRCGGPAEWGKPCPRCAEPICIVPGCRNPQDATAENPLLCSAHAMCADLARIGQPEKIARAHCRMRAIFEKSWERLADDPEMDPVTVARCKVLRDIEVEVLP